MILIVKAFILLFKPESAPGAGNGKPDLNMKD